MERRRERAFIDFSLPTTWANPRELWEYLWIVYRLAEPPNERTKAGDAFVALMHATEAGNIDGESIEWAFTGESIAIKRSDVYRVVDRYVRSAKSNYLIESKPPHKYLRRLAADRAFLAPPPRKEWEQPKAPPTLREVFNGDPANLAALNQHFGSENVRFDFRGYPLIGWRRDYVWFGITAFRHLWLQASEVRAAALEYPFRPLPEFLYLPWSPVAADWVPPLVPWDRFPQPAHVMRVDLCAPNLFRLVGDLEPVPELPANCWRLSTNITDAPELLCATQTEDETRAALSAIDAYRDTHVFGSVAIATLASTDSVAQDVHLVQARSEHPVRFSYLTETLLLQYGRHFPWIFHNPMYGPHLRIEARSLVEEIAFVCYMEAWWFLQPFISRSWHRRCWRDLNLPGDFDAILAAFIKFGTIEVQEDNLFLNGLELGRHFSTASPYTELADRVENWFLDQGQLDPEMDLGRINYADEPSSESVEWRKVVMRIVENSRVVNKAFQRIDRPFRAVHALQVLSDRFTDDLVAVEELAKLQLTFFDIGVGLCLLNRIMEQKGRALAFDILARVTFDAYVATRGKRMDRSVELLEIDLDDEGRLKERARDLGVPLLRTIWAAADKDERVRAFIHDVHNYIEDHEGYED